MPPKGNKKKATRANRASIRRAKNTIKNEVKKLERKEGDLTQTMTKIQNTMKRLPQKSRKAVVASPIFTRLEEWVRQFLLIDDECPPLPSPFRESVQVHNLPFAMQVPIKYANPQGFYAFMTQPNLERFIRIAVPGTATATLKDDTETNATDHKVDTGRIPDNRLLCSDKSWTVGNGMEIAPILANRGTFPLTAIHWSSNRKNWIDGLKVYPVGSILSGDEPLIHFKNTASSPLTVLAVWNVYDAAQTNLAQVTSAPTVVNGNDGMDLPFTPGQWNSIILPLYGITAYVSYGVQLNNAGNPIPEIGPDCKIVLKQGAAHLELGTPLVWEDKSFWDVCSQDPESTVALKAQYKLASHVKFGLYEVTVKNATPNIALGGLIASAQFAGGTRASSILKDPEELFPYIETLPHDASGAMDFKTGQHYFFKPEKIQDWMFKLLSDEELITEYLEHDAPKIVSSIYSPPSLGTAPIINLQGKAHFEYLTQDRSATQRRAGGDTLGQIQVLLSAMRSIPQFTENPKHLNTILNGIKSVVRSPLFKKIAIEIGTMGLELLV